VLERVNLEPDRPEPERIVRRNFTLGPERGARVVVTRRLESRELLPTSGGGMLS
jgi:hypothetical protein